MRKQRSIEQAAVGLQKTSPTRPNIAAATPVGPAAPAKDEPLPSNQPGELQTMGARASPHLGSVSLFMPNVRRTVRRAQLREIVPLADTTVYEMEQRGEFPRRFYLTPRCVVWDLGEVEAWVVARRQASDAAMIKRAPTPNVRKRRTRPVTR
jgi:prophage regulatory protein